MADDDLQRRGYDEGYEHLGGRRRPHRRRQGPHRPARRPLARHLRRRRQAHARGGGCLALWTLRSYGSIVAELHAAQERAGDRRPGTRRGLPRPDRRWSPSTTRAASRSRPIAPRARRHRRPRAPRSLIEGQGDRLEIRAARPTPSGHHRRRARRRASTLSTTDHTTPGATTEAARHDLARDGGAVRPPAASRTADGRPLLRPLTISSIGETSRRAPAVRGAADGRTARGDSPGETGEGPTFEHRPVMVDEVVAALAPGPRRGAGRRHGRRRWPRRALCSPPIPTSCSSASTGTTPPSTPPAEALAPFGDRVTLRRARFDHLTDDHGGPRSCDQASAVLFDLGVSSPQLDVAERGLLLPPRRPPRHAHGPPPAAHGGRRGERLRRGRRWPRVLRTLRRRALRHADRPGDRRRPPARRRPPSSPRSCATPSPRPPAAPAATRPSARSRRVRIEVNDELADPRRLDRPGHRLPRARRPLRRARLPLGRGPHREGAVPPPRHRRGRRRRPACRCPTTSSRPCGSCAACAKTPTASEARRQPAGRERPPPRRREAAPAGRHDRRRPPSPRRARLRRARRRRGRRRAPSGTRDRPAAAARSSTPAPAAHRPDRRRSAPCSPSPSPSPSSRCQAAARPGPAAPRRPRRPASTEAADAATSELRLGGGRARVARADRRRRRATSAWCRRRGSPTSRRRAGRRRRRGPRRRHRRADRRGDEALPRRHRVGGGARPLRPLRDVRRAG